MGCMERVTWRHTLPYKTDSQWDFSVRLRGLKPGLVSNLKGWKREGDGMDVQVGGHVG